MSYPPRLARERLDVGVDHVDRGHRPEGTVAEVRAIVQRVNEASVAVDGERIAEIGPGLLVLLGVHRDDTEEHADRLVRKLLALRIFQDDDGRMNRSVSDVGGEILCVSQFTLYGDARKGSRPSFVDAARPDRLSPSMSTSARRWAREVAVSAPTCS